MLGFMHAPSMHVSAAARRTTESILMRVQEPAAAAPAPAAEPTPEPQAAPPAEEAAPTPAAESAPPAGWSRRAQ
jgi:hypothetical protein